MGRGVRAAVGLALACGWLACSSSSDSGGGSPQPAPGTGSTRQHPASGQSWTVLVYMVADNNLEADALRDLTEMMSVGSGPGFNLVVQVDRARGFSNDAIGGLANWTTTKRLRVQAGALEELADLGETDMASAASLSDFISYGVCAFPADRVALLMWDHGGAWTAFGVDEDAPGASGGTDRMDLNRVRDAIAAGRTASGLQQFALLGFDACLMATYEVARALSPHGEYLLASEELEPGHGWNWAGLGVARQTPSTAPLALGQQLIDTYRQQAQEARTDATITLSLTDLYALDPLIAAVSALAGVYPSQDAFLASSIGRGRTAALEFGASPNPAQSFQMFDLGSLASSMATQASQAASASNAIQSALRQAVVAKTSGAQTSTATGLSIYFPASMQLYDSAYDGLTEAADWRAFLQRYLQGSSDQPVFTSQDATAQLSGSDLTLTGQLASGTGALVTEATLFTGFAQDDGSLVVVGDRPAAVSVDQVQGGWDLTVLQLVQGRKSGFGYLSLSQGEGNTVLATIPFAYFRNSAAQAQQALRVLVIDAGGNVTQDTYYLEVDGALGGLQPVTGSVLLPLVAIYDPSTDTTRFDVLATGAAADFDGAQPIDLRLVSLARGTPAFGILQVQDYLGRTSNASGVVSAP